MRNVGTLDRVLRAALGLALLYFAFLSGLPAFEGAVVRYAAAAVGAVMLVTASIRICPLYAVLGLKTFRD